ncbi:hypothetical protein [Rossellomorea marisflavi]|uniref:hypothetical protein n=1 Tax=Rossellomorea marisflavi TaxID=189381 RepID=UPI00345938DC
MQQLAEGVTKHFSTQLEHADSEEQLKLIRDAEVKAPQAAARLKRYETSRKQSRDVFYRKKLNVMFR